MADNQCRTVQQFKEEHPEIDGMKVYLCEHLENGVQTTMNYNQWLGDNTRVFLCPVCTKVSTQGAIDFVTKEIVLITNNTKMVG